LADYRHLRALTEEKQRFAVIGGGFIGWEIAAALAMNGKDVVMLFPEEYIGHRLYPPDLGHFLNRFYAQKGIEVRAETMVTDLNRRGNDLVLTTRPANGDGGGEVSVDAVVGGIGIVPNVGLAKEAGLAVSDGIEVDEYLRTSHPGIFAAGDVAVFYSPALGKRLRMEHEDNAKAMGRQAGRAMAGAQEPYHYLPFFYSDLFELGYEAVGMVDSRLETVSEWTEPNHEGVIAYLEAGRVRGVLLWNVWERVDAARQVVARGDALNEPALRSLLRAKFLRRVAA
jgi:3-phenylpropionate/trans-cinnamate dioxygenase ferredoxin reductase subunit